MGSTKMKNATETTPALAMNNYFCGDSAVDWQGQPIRDFCKATRGSAYTPGGVCGNVSKKYDLMNAASASSPDPRAINNVASLTCMLGLGDCDIYYCQKCR